MKIRDLMISTGLILLFAGTVIGKDKSSERLHKAGVALKEIMDTPDHSIPQGLLDRAQCIVIVPEMKKAAFIFGARYGKGYISCRQENGVGWISPGTIRIEGGSFGFQIGGAVTDLVLLVMNKSGADKLLASQFTLGAEASVAAGPVGRSTKVETDVLLRAQILSWSRSHGIFAGISLQGATLRQDISDNRELYGRTLENREIIEKNLQPPTAAKELISLLDKYSPKKGSD